MLAEEGFVHLVDGTWQWTQETYPADAVSLRSVTSDNFVVIDMTDGERVIGETDFTSGPSTLHEKAIYIVEGQLFQVERFDYDNRKAYVRAVECDYYTDAITYTKVTILETFRGRGAGTTPGRQERRAARPRRSARRLARGRVQEDQVLHERERGLGRARAARAADAHDVVLADDAARRHGALPYAPTERRDGVVGLAFAMRQLAPLLLMCDRHDLGLSVDGVNLEGGARLGGQSRG